ncbi:hypothetical protein [Pseudoduganella ginsengisoli]|uniref:Uncharacterized protein n=1 Tax=Pseudoduganella ginsengisoli TaxID=1462440 RepID=A0A6L6Q5V8_9BURK|nr:hypothetical protein [Pseudoduganella ginsengisoli]MTW04935.1 hypothetical protein [Pseudoduganella ginsengisoli]
MLSKAYESAIEKTAKVFPGLMKSSGQFGVNLENSTFSTVGPKFQIVAGSSRLLPDMRTSSKKTRNIGEFAAFESYWHLRKVGAAFAGKPMP